MKIEAIESGTIADWVDVKFNDTTHYEVYAEHQMYNGNTTWIVNECGYSGRGLRSNIDTKARAVALALQFLATDILENDWAEEHHSEPFKVLCHACSDTFETPRNHGKPWCCPECHNEQISVVN